MNALAHPRRQLLAGLAASIAVGLGLVFAGALATQMRPGGEAAATTDDDRVVATLQTSGWAYSDALRARLRTARANPDDLAAAKSAARQLIDDGRAAGDPRLVGAALGVLRPFLDAADAEALYLSATARQYQHDFSGALELLDRSLALSPRDADALLTRATINVVLGRFDMANGDCRRLHALRPDLGFLCQATALTLTAAAPAVYRRLEGIATQPGLLDASLRAHALGLMGEIAALQGNYDLARAHFAAVLAEEPGAVRVRTMLADVLLADGHDAAALEILHGAPEVDGVLLRRATAADRLGQSALLDTTKAELSRRFRRNLDLGMTAHAREEARFYLQIERDPRLALARAEINWELQHEIEDAQLLIDAAVAAGAPAAAAPVLRWMDEQQVSVPTLRIPDAVLSAEQ